MLTWNRCFMSTVNVSKTHLKWFIFYSFQRHTAATTEKISAKTQISVAYLKNCNNIRWICLRFVKHFKSNTNYHTDSYSADICEPFKQFICKSCLSIKNKHTDFWNVSTFHSNSGLFYLYFSRLLTKSNGYWPNTKVLLLELRNRIKSYKCNVQCACIVPTSIIDGDDDDDNSDGVVSIVDFVISLNLYTYINYYCLSLRVRNMLRTIPWRFLSRSCNGCNLFRQWKKVHKAAYQVSKTSNPMWAQFE